MVDIRYIQSYDLQINIGRGYNRAIKDLPADCWVCINDHDSMFLYQRFGHQLVEIIEKHGNDYDLFGCMTNRLRGEHQLYEGKFSADYNVQNHFYIANKLAQEHYTEVEETTGVAGVMMLFKRSMWEKVGGFKEGLITADTEFNKAIKRTGGKVGLMKGVYLMHAYRLQHNDRLIAANDVKHLQLR